MEKDSSQTIPQVSFELKCAQCDFIRNTSVLKDVAITIFELMRAEGHMHQRDNENHHVDILVPSMMYFQRFLSTEVQ